MNRAKSSKHNMNSEKNLDEALMRQLHRYAREHRHTQVSFRDERPLGLFVFNARSLYARGHLPAHRAREFEAVVFWRWEILRSPSGAPL
jgi:hypothetical protein